MPFGARPVMTSLHYFAMIVVTVNLVWRVWYAFFSKARDWKEFRIQKKDAVTLVGVAKFYAYLSNNKPHVAKYNVMQKGTYICLPDLMLVQAFTGFSLLTRARDPRRRRLRDVLIGWWLGAAARQRRPRGVVDAHRALHHQLVFIIVTTIHVYLSATIDIPSRWTSSGSRRWRSSRARTATTIPAEPAKPIVVPASGTRVEPTPARALARREAAPADPPGAASRIRERQKETMSRVYAELRRASRSTPARSTAR